MHTADEADRVTVEPRLEELFEEHQHRLFRLALRLSRNREDAKDLVQETFVRAARHERSLPSGARAEGWLVRTMINLARDEWRRRAVRNKHAVARAQEDSSDPEAVALARISVRSALQTLSPKLRAVVALVDLEALSSREAAILLGLRPSTVRWYRARALRELERLLDTED